MTKTKFLEEDITYPILFTRGRIDKQITIKYFTDSMVKSLIVVTAASEKDSLKQRLHADGFEFKKLIYFPDNYRLVEKRYLAAKWLYENGGRKFIFFDDDLRLQVLIDGKYRSSKTDEGRKELDNIWSGLPKLWKRYSGIGLCASTRNNLSIIENLPKEKLKVQANKLTCAAFGFDAKTFLDACNPMYKHRLMRSMAYIDNLSNLQVMTDGHNTCKLFNMAWSTKTDTKVESGGMNAYRNTKTDLTAILIAKLLSPGRITKKPSDKDTFGATKKLTRLASIPPKEWTRSKFKFAEWLDQIDSDLKRLKVSSIDDLEIDDLGKKYLKALYSKLEILSGRKSTRYKVVLSDRDTSLFSKDAYPVSILKDTQVVWRGNYADGRAEVITFLNLGHVVPINLEINSIKNMDMETDFLRATVKNWLKTPEMK